MCDRSPGAIGVNRIRPEPIRQFRTPQTYDIWVQLWWGVQPKLDEKTTRCPSAMVPVQEEVDLLVLQVEVGMTLAKEPEPGAQGVACIAAAEGQAAT